MGESNDSDIAVVLLGFSGLDKTQRDEFMDKLNEFIYVSPQRKRRLVEGWLESCLSSSDPAVNRVAESMAAYVVHDRKPPKSR